MQRQAISSLSATFAVRTVRVSKPGVDFVNFAGARPPVTPCRSSTTARFACLEGMSVLSARTRMDLKPRAGRSFKLRTKTDDADCGCHPRKSAVTPIECSGARSNLLSHSP